MSERSERLFSAMSQLPDARIDGAAAPPAYSTRVHRWRHWGTAAACVTLIAMTATIFPHISGCGASGDAEAPQANGGGSTEFASYAGPILPLTLQTPDDAITAERTITLDFSPWVPQWWSNEQEAASRTELTAAERQEVLEQYDTWHPEGGRWRTGDELLVQDEYLLTNHSGEARTVTVQLPVVSSLSEIGRAAPVLTLDGEPLSGELVAGGSTSAQSFSTWADYQQLLEDGSYREKAQEPPAWTAEDLAVIYALTEPYGPEGDRDHCPNPSVQAAFDLDYGRTQVLSYGFNGGSNDWEQGHMVREFSIWHRENQPQQNPALLIVLGEDIQNFTTSFHVTGGSDPATPQLEHAGVTVTRYEAPLAEALRWVLENASLAWEQPQLLSPDDLYSLLLEQLDYGVDPEEVNRTGGMLEEQLSLMYWTPRVFWLQADVTIPAGESRFLSASSCKEPSRNFGGSGTQELLGFDLAPWLDSSLEFTVQTAALETREQIEIVRENFGFAPENGMDSVILDPAVPHYYLEVTRAADVPTGAPTATP